MISVLFGLILAVTPTQLDKDGRTAFNALRDFQRIVATEYKTQGRWPTLEQYKSISQNIECAYQGISASMIYGIEPPNSQVLSMMRHSMNCVELINQYVHKVTDQPDSTPEAKKAILKAVAAYKKLMLHFPWVPGEK